MWSSCRYCAGSHQHFQSCSFRGEVRIEHIDPKHRYEQRTLYVWNPDGSRRSGQ